MIRRLAVRFFVLLGLLLLAPTPSLEAKKKKDSAPVAAKIVKASETPYKQAKLYSKQTKKKKKFRWFGKKSGKKAKRSQKLEFQKLDTKLAPVK